MPEGGQGLRLFQQEDAIEPSAAFPIVDALYAALAPRLPLSLSSLLARFEDVEDYSSFAAVVRELLPECAGEILMEPGPIAQIRCFVRHFEARYFPVHRLADLEEWEDESPYGLMLSAIPLDVSGIDDEDRHELPQQRDGIRLMAALVPDFDEGWGIALLESCEDILPPRLLQRIPPQGYPQEDRHAALDDTEFAAVALVGDWLWNDTGNLFMDMTYEMEGQYQIGWALDNVEFLTTEWHESQAIWTRITDLADRLEKSPVRLFKKILDLLERGGDRESGHDVPVGAAGES